ncbi:exosome component Rrp6 [Oratosquilla oratoria]|uniref:exosome component Rrp6 n=1 Tax=Oratosquilla oratoria TaxID=337810 RepID=UPI003F76133F
MTEPNQEGPRPFMGHPSVDDYIKKVMGSVRACQRLCGDVEGWQHYQDFRGVHRTMNQLNNAIMDMVGKLFSHQEIRLNLHRNKLLTQFDMIREGNDILLERINSDIDEAAGLKKNAGIENMFDQTLKTIRAPADSTSSGHQIVLRASRNVQKPQLFFKEKVNNSAKEPFLPTIKDKPNSMKPLCLLPCVDDTGLDFYPHPYEYELIHWSPMASQLMKVDPVEPLEICTTPFVMVDTEHDLLNVISELKCCQEFAVDVEHHGYRTYLGLTCLIQISTRDKDYVIDPLVLRGQLHHLNEVFTDPKITKVLHGADYDVLWLQRDCGVYMVNLFDTHQAAVVLQYPHRSLAALLSKFCDIDVDKTYQRADWRIRPLPQEFLDYARKDSHFLLYIYDMLRNELIEKGDNLNNLIHIVYRRSTELCLKRYEKPYVGPESHMEMYRRSRKLFNSQQLYALKHLYLWRDKAAREHDESAEYVLPKHQMLQISEVLPKEMQGILACCNPIPPLVKMELLTLHNLVRSAREQHLHMPEPSPLGESLVQQEVIEDLTTVISLRHDTSQVEDHPSQLPTLMEQRETMFGNLFQEHEEKADHKDSSTLFHCSRKELMWQKPDRTTTLFLSPFDRHRMYLELKPLLDDGRKKSANLDDQARVERVREHFLSLTKCTPTKAQAPPPELASQSGQTSALGGVHQNAPELGERHQASEDSCQASGSGNGDMSGNFKDVQNKKMSNRLKPVALRHEMMKPHKRRSNGEQEIDDFIKKVRLSTEGTENQEGEGDAEAQAEVDGDGEPQQAVTPFDYSNVDFSMFKGQKSDRPRGQKYEGKFKGKGQKSSGMRKSGLKSFTWGKKS